MHNSGNTPDTQLPIPVDVLPAASRLAVLRSVFDAITARPRRDPAGASGRYRREAFVRLNARFLFKLQRAPSLKQASASIFMVLWSLGRPLGRLRQSPHVTTPRPLPACSAGRD